MSGTSSSAATTKVRLNDIGQINHLIIGAAYGWSMSNARREPLIAGAFAFGRRFRVLVSTLGAVLVFGSLGFSAKTMRDGARQASQEAVHVAELRGNIGRLDERMAMAARMAAMSGESRWTELFDEAAPKLDFATAEARSIASGSIQQALAETMGEAHGNLVAIERRALTLAAGGDLRSARALLDGPEFAYLQEVYADGLEVFAQDLKTLVDVHAADLDARAWIETGAIAMLAIVLVAAALALRGHLRLRTAMAHTEAIAGTDLLTGLPNRRRFCQEFEAALLRGKQVGLDHALLLVDLDRFKAVNDAHGHPTGDELLRLVGERLRTVLQPDQPIARFGGDEFALFLCCKAAGSDGPQADPRAVGRRIVDALSLPFALADGTTVKVGASVGIGLTQRDDDGVDGLLHRADVSLYRAKAEGRGCVRVFEPAMDVHARALALLESDLRRAVAAGEIIPHFQPLVDIKTGRLLGVEMLARWTHAKRGSVSPAEFIPVAETSGLIAPMTLSLLRQGCYAAVHWPAHVTLACNLSPLQLHDPTLPGTIAAVLTETGFPADRLEIEVTESALVGDIDLARRLLNELKALGVRLALDDFGTGYASLRHLKLLPFDKLKIDQSFVAGMLHDRESAKIVSAVIGLGHSLGLTTVAEGVETVEVAALLEELGCDIGQGWLFGRPVPGDQIDAMLTYPREPKLPKLVMVV